MLPCSPPARSGSRTGEPTREGQEEAARFTVGAALLAVGVVVQLVGYASNGGWWLPGLAIGVFVLAALVPALKHLR